MPKGKRLLKEGVTESKNGRTNHAIYNPVQQQDGTLP